MFKFQLVLVLLLVPFAAAAIDYGDLDSYSSRFPPFSSIDAGVQGGIPDTSDVVKWPICTNASCTLTSESTISDIQDAIDYASTTGCGGTEGCVVSVPAGTWDFGIGATGNTGLYIKSNVVLRGAGISSTHFLGSGPEHPDNSTYGNEANGLSGTIVFAAPRNIDDRAVTDVAYPNGMTTFHTSTTSINVGDLVEIQVQSHDFDWMDHPCGTPPCDSAKYPAHVGVVSSIDSGAGTITLDRPIILPMTSNDSAAGHLDSWTPVQNAGIEDLHIYATDVEEDTDSPGQAEAGRGHVVIIGAMNVWVKDNFIDLGNYMLVTQDIPATNVSVVGNKFGNTQYFEFELKDSGGNDYLNNSNSYPVNVRSYSLVANNEFDKPNIQVFFGKYVSNMSVAAYNYVHNTSSGQYGHGFFVHGRGTNYNLVEGNVTDGVVRVGESYWGPGLYNTFYRNRSPEIGVEDLFGGTYRVALYPAVVGNISYRFWLTSGCANPTNYLNGWCSNPLDYLTEHGLYLYNLATDDAASVQWRGFMMSNPALATSDCGTGEGNCGSGDAPHGVNIEGLNRGASWSGMDIPPSLFFADRADWEAKTGATWCQEACDFDDVYSGVGAWGDTDSDGDGTFSTACEIPAQITAESGSCTAYGETPPSGGSVLYGGSLSGGSIQ